MNDEIVYKPAGVAETFSLSWQRYIVDSWSPDRRYIAGAIMRPPVGDGFYYVASLLDVGDSFGMSAKIMPDFLSGEGEVTNDGSVVWTARRPGSLALVGISISNWSLDAGIVEDAKGIVGFDTTITVSGGVEGERYRMTNTITKGTGEKEEGSVVLEILAPIDV